MQRRIILYLSLVFMVAILAGYVFVYQTSPFLDEWNNFLLTWAAPFSAALAAVGSAVVLRYYSKKDKPYLVWLYFTIGMWVWVLAESVWSYLFFTTGEVPILGLSDALWFVGYGLLTAALHSQYQLVYQKKISWWKVAGVWVGMMALTPAILVLFQSEFTLENFVAYLYPVIDFVLCVASFRLFVTFGAGKLSRPWIGLFVLGISDSVYAWLEVTGQYQASSDAGTWLSLLADTTYVAAYLILAIGFLIQYLLLRLGPES
jgi:hypothetical protein